MNLRALGKSLKAAVDANGYAFARTSGINAQQLLALARQFGELWNPRYSFLNVRYDANDARLSQAFDRKPLPPHCECAYELEPPRYIVFHCDGASRSGGEFFLVRMRDVLARLRAADNAALRTTPYDVMSPLTGATAARLLVSEVDGVGDALVLLPIPPAGESVIYALPAGRDHAAKLLLRRVAKTAADPSLRIAHRWRRGDVAVVDNARFLHGREGFAGTTRQLKHLRIGRFVTHPASGA
jgi:alpha-ketoglutarate-dependent taurine dioxygenase